MSALPRTRFPPEFRNRVTYRPASIIITTLAARSYRQQRQTYEALLQIVRDMPRFIENRNGTWWVANPVHPGENFADKWNEAPKKKDAFIAWLKIVETDLLGMAGRSGRCSVTAAVFPAMRKGRKLWWGPAAQGRPQGCRPEVHRGDQCRGAVRCVLAGREYRRRGCREASASRRFLRGSEGESALGDHCIRRYSLGRGVRREERALRGAIRAEARQSLELGPMSWGFSGPNVVKHCEYGPNVQLTHLPHTDTHDIKIIQ